MARRRQGRGGGGGAGGRPAETAALGWVIAGLILVGVLLYAWHRERQSQLPPTPSSTQTTPPVSPPLPTPPLPTPPGPTPQPVPDTGLPPAEVWSGSPNLFLGNPSQAGKDRDNFLLEHNGFALSYNDSRGGPNWVSWRLRREDTGDAPRARYFSPDPLLPAGFTLIAHQDYTGSGFDRGHLCPHSDRDGTRESSDETFLMTNILPQAPTLNQKPWKTLEDYSRELVRDGTSVVFAVAGGTGTGGTGSKGPAERIGKGKVAVPAKCWKILVIVPSGGAGRPSDLTAGGSKVIAVMMPNEEKIGLRWQAYQLTVEDLERETGYRFMTTLRPEVASELKRRRP